MMRELAQLHIRAMPHTWNSRRGATFVSCLYFLVSTIGYIGTEERGGHVVGAISGIGKLILTLVVDPGWQNQGIGRKLVSKLGGNVWVYTEERSLGFYQKLKFREVIRIGKIIILWK